MVIEKLEPYVSNKLLQKKISKKTRDEILDILKDVPTVDDDEWKAVADALLKLPAEVMYDFVRGIFNSLREDQRDMLCSLIFDKCKQGSARLVLYSVVALNAVSDTTNANRLLSNLITVRWKNGKFDVNMPPAFCGTVELDGGDFLFQKHEDWDMRTMGIYAELLIQSAEREKSPVHEDKIRSWFAENDLEPNVAQETRLTAISVDKPELSDGKNDVAKKTDFSDTEKKIDGSKSKMLCDYSFADLMTELTVRFQNLESRIKELETGRDVALKENAELKDQLSWLTSARSTAENELANTKDMLSVEKRESAKLKAESEVLSKERSDLQNRCTDLENKYIDLSNSFDQKLKAETDAFCVEIEKRLVNDYKMFNDMKSLDPDIEYYGALVATLDKVFKTLINVGIKL